MSVNAGSDTCAPSPVEPTKVRANSSAHTSPAWRMSQNYISPRVGSINQINGSSALIVTEPVHHSDRCRGSDLRCGRGRRHPPPDQRRLCILRRTAFRSSFSMRAPRSNGEILGSPDDLKFGSSMTLFHAVSNHPIFGNALGKFYCGASDQATLDILRKQSIDEGSKT